MKIIKAAFCILLMISIMITGFFLPDAVLYFVDRENLYIKNREMPEVTLNLIPELSVAKKVCMASYAEYSDGVADKMLRSSGEDVKQTAEIFLSDILSEMDVFLKDCDYSVICCKPRMYFCDFSNIQETAVLWDIDFYFFDETVIQIVVDDTNRQVLSFGIFTCNGYNDEISNEFQQLADIVMKEIAINLGVKNSWKLIDEHYEGGCNTGKLQVKLYDLYLTEMNKTIYDRFSFDLNFYMSSNIMYAGRGNIIDNDIAIKIAECESEILFE